MGEIGRVQRPDPAINAPHLLHRVQQSDDRHQRRHGEQPPQEDQVELHQEDECPPSVVMHFTDEDPPHGLDLAV